MNYYIINLEIIWGEKMKIRQISRHIYKVEETILSNFVSAWIVVDDNEIYLVDTLMLKAKKQLQKHIDEYGKLKAILLTHGHFDHVGGLTYLLKHNKVPVYANILEIPYLTGQSDYNTNFFNKKYILKALNIRSSDIGALSSDEDNNFEMIGPLKPYLVPGHTTGNMVYYHIDDDVLLGGDILDFKEGQLLPSPDRFNNDTTLSIKNAIAIIKELNPNFLSLTHSPDDIILPVEHLKNLEINYLK